MAIQVRAGEPLPEIAGQTQSGAVVSTSQFRGQWLVVYFYPKDKTPGCSREAQAFDAALESLRSRGAEVIGVSVDSAASHRSFADTYGLRFPLIADPDKQITRRLGLINEKGTSARRTTLLVDPEGRVVRVFENVKVDGHVEAVLQALDEARQVYASTRQG